MVSIKYWFIVLIAKLRVFNGMCPMCNSDAPELYDCPICEYYRGEFPPAKETKEEWYKLYIQALNAQRSAMRILKNFKKEKQQDCVNCGRYCTGKSAFCTPSIRVKK